MSKYQKKEFSPHIYHDWIHIFHTCTTEQRSEILLAITDFPNYQPKNVPLWDFIRSQLAEQLNHFTDIANKNTQNAKKTTANDGQRPLPTDNDGQPSETNINKNINNILNNNLYINKIYVDDNFSIPVDDFFNQYRKELGNEIINQVENWIKTTQKGKYIDKQFVCKQFINFAQRQNKPLLRA